MFVSAFAARGKNFNHQVGWALQILLREEMRVLLCQVNEIGHNDVELRQQDVERRDKGFADGMRLQISHDQMREAQHDPLVPRRGRRTHVMDSVDNLVPLAIVRNPDVVCVGKLVRRMSRPHHPVLRRECTIV